MNGKPVPALHGFPLRLVITGYPGSASQKHLTRIWVRDQVHDGPKMTGYSYRIPGYPVAPGTEVPESDVEILTVMPVKSIVTFPQTGSQEGGDVALSSEYGNLPDTPGVEETYFLCSACHSLSIIKQQRLPPSRWDYLWTWMVETQGMPEQEPETKPTILSYLKRHFAWKD